MRLARKILIWTLAIAAILTGIVYAIFEPWTVPGDDAQFVASIEPGLSPGDIVLVMRSTGVGDGALARCPDPDQAQRHVVARVMGLGGDDVAFTGGNLSINNKIPSAPQACDPGTVRVKNPGTQEETELSCFLEESAGSVHAALRNLDKSAERDVKAKVETGKLYLVSDNRAFHLDSRDFGQVSPGNCQRVAFRIMGTTGWGDSKKRFTVFW